MIESRACPECGAEVPIGRLSCGACGALLASVDRHPADEPSAGTRASIISPAARADVAAPIGPVATAEVPAPTEVAEPTAPAASLAAPAPATPSAAVPASASPSAASPDASPAALPAPVAAPLATLAAPEEIELPLPPMPPIPGAYLAPSVVTRSAPITTTRLFPAAPRTRLEPTAPTDQPLSEPEHASPVEPAPASPVEPAPAPPARAAVLDLPFAIAPGIGPRLVAAGAALSIVAFVLPWVSNGGVVVGGAFGTGYFSSWGLAAVGNVLPFLVAWVSLVLAVLPNRVPRFAALGVLPLLLGGIFAGFGWTYLIGPLGAGIGIWALATGAVLLAAGGTLVLRGEGSAG